MTPKCHVRFGERGRETRLARARQVRSAPTPFSPVVANVCLHDALDQWFEKVVKPHGRGEALLSRDADDLVCAFRFCRDAEWLSQALPNRLGKFKLEVAREKTRILRFSRFHPGMTRRFTF